MEILQSSFVILLLCLAFGAILSGIPVAYALSGAALLVAGLAAQFNLFDPAFLTAIPSRIFAGTMYNEVLSAVPLFIIMGIILERTKIAEQLLSDMGKLSSGIPGGLGISVTFVGMLLAASTGIVGATVIAMGILSLPSMLNQGYKPSLAAGTVCASGTLGQIIPPSIVLIFLSDQLSASYLQAQREIGNFSALPITVSDLFAGALIPGIGLAVLFMIYQLTMGILKPTHAPKVANDTQVNLAQICGSLAPPILLVLCVLGSILMGIATPTEAAGVGAFGALLLGGKNLAKEVNIKWAETIIQAAFISAIALLLLTQIFDLRLTVSSISSWNKIGLLLAFIACGALSLGAFTSIYVLHQARELNDVLHSAMRISTIAFTILIGATIFSLIFRGLGGEELVLQAMQYIPGGPIGAVIAVSILIFILGFFLDFIEIIFIIMPIVAPIIFQSDINPIWFGILVAMNLQTSFLTPPFGFALFYLKSVAPKKLSTIDIYKGVIPFIIIQLCALILVFMFPQLATWLPDFLFN